MVTVGVDLACVESRLCAGEIGCPTCRDGVLGGWGYARVRQIEGLGDPVRPRRARCRACLVTHVLLPVTMLLRRAYAAKRIWAALTARAEGFGHRRIGVRLGVPASTVRGWLRRVGSRLETTRVWFLQVAVTAGVDVTIPDATGCAWGDVVAEAEPDRCGRHRGSESVQHESPLTPEPPDRRSSPRRPPGTVPGGP